ncbi:MAG: Pvc16 family protein [Chloroflexota bacterium]
MIADLDRTIENLLSAEIPIKNGEIDVKFEQPKREWSARLARPTLNFFLYDVRENNILRQHQWQQSVTQNGRAPDHVAQLKRTPYRFDMNYMVTAWATEAQDEHRLLANCMLALLRHPILPRAHFVGDMESQPYEVQARLGYHDKLTNPAEVWSSLDNEIRPSISYVVTIALDPWTTVARPIAHTFTFRTGQQSNGQQLNKETISDTISIRGIITKDNQPLAGVEVGLKGTGFFATTNAEGQFYLNALPPGDYTAVVWLPDAKPAERSISVPTTDTYDIQL